MRDVVAAEAECIATLFAFHVVAEHKALLTRAFVSSKR